MANEKFKVKFGLAVGDTAATIDGTTGNIATNGDIDVKGGDITNSTGALNITSGGTNTDITITPNGTGDVSISADTLFIGDGGASASITTSGTGSLFLNTNNSVNSGSISIIEGVNGTISLDPNGTGVVQVTKNLNVDGNINANGQIILNTDQTPGSYAYQAYSGAVQGSLTWDGTNWSATGGINSDGAEFGDVTVGVVTDNTISTTAGDLNLTSTTGIIELGAIVDVTGDYVNINSDGTFANSAVRFGGSAEIVYTAATDKFEITKPIGAITIGQTTDNTINTTTGNLTLDSVGGNIILNSNGTLGMTLAPITGFNPNADFTGNIVKGAIRTGAGEATGDIFQGSGGATPSTGISIDNTDKVADRTSLVMRNYGASLTGGFPRNTIVWEAARGTAAAPLALGLNDSIGEIMATGYTSTGFVADQTTQITTGIIRLRAAEAWSSGLNNTGTQLLVALQPTATALTTSSLVGTLVHSPQATFINSNAITLNQGKNTPTGGTTLTMSGPGTTGGAYLSVGDVNIAQMNSSWQTTFAPGFKYTGLMSSSTQNSNGSTFEMSSRWKAAAADVAYVIPQNGWGLGKFNFSADNTTNNSNQVVCGEIRARATENWSNLTTGSKLTFNANRKGAVNDGRVVLDMSPETTNLTSDVFNVFNTTTQQLYNNVSQGKFYAGNPAGATFNERTSQLRVQTASTSPGDASTIVFNTGNYNTGTGNFSPTVAGDTLGEFFFGGNYGTTSSFTTLGTSVRFAGKAAENFTATNSGGRMVISMDKIGGNVQYDAITIDSLNAVISSNDLTLNNNNGVALIGNNITYGRVYGQWRYDTTITPAAINTAYVFPIGTADYNNIATVGSTTRIIPGAAGKYTLQFGIQIANGPNPGANAYIWLRKNGVDVAGSTQVFNLYYETRTFTGGNWMLDSANTTDYYEIAYAVDALQITFPAFAATAFCPASSNLVTTLTPVGA